MLRVADRLRRRAIFFGLLLCMSSAWGGALVESYLKALSTDSAFQTARSELEVNTLTAVRSSRAYWPDFSIRLGARSEAGGTQTTTQLVQPLYNSDRLATWLGAEPQQIHADTVMQVREIQLAQRYFSTVAELVRARESIRLNRRKVEALEQQSNAAKQSYQLGAGTLTDMRDTQVRLDQTRAESISLNARLSAAESRYRSMTGTQVLDSQFVLKRLKRNHRLPPLNEMLDLARQANPDLVMARQAERLAELDVWRKRGSLTPQVNLVMQQTQVAQGGNSKFVGVTLDFPFQTTSLLNIDISKAQSSKVSGDLRTVEINTQLEVERLYGLAKATEVEVDIRIDAIDSAQLSLEANQQSFIGGVRSRLDVLNSIQTYYQVQEQYVQARLTQAEYLISLYSLLAVSPEVVLTDTEALLF